MILAKPNWKGLPNKEWNEVIDLYMKHRVMIVNDYEKMDEYQLFTIQALKRHFKRVKYQNRVIPHKKGKNAS